LAKIAYDLRADEKVIQILSQCNTAKECNIKGLSLYRLQDYWGSSSAFEKAMQLDKGNAETYVNYADLLFDVNDLEGALLYYDRAVAMDESMVKAYYGKYKILSMLWKKQEAIEYLDKIIELDPDNIVLYFCKKSTEYSALKQDKEAADYLNKAYTLVKTQGLNLNTRDEELVYINQVLNYHELENKILHSVVVPLTTEIKEVASVLRHVAFQNDKVNTYKDYGEWNGMCDARTSFYENSYGQSNLDQ
jgi:tetratricopeptide (TPR) repeat protein